MTGKRCTQVHFAALALSALIALMMFVSCAPKKAVETAAAPGHIKHRLESKLEESGVEFGWVRCRWDAQLVTVFVELPESDEGFKKVGDICLAIAEVAQSENVNWETAVVETPTRAVRIPMDNVIDFYKSGGKDFGALQRAWKIQEY